MKILVTGGAGFIGSHLCEFLLSLNHSVVCVDNLFTGSKKNISHLQANPGFRFVNQDIIDPFYLDDVDQVYNLACPASPIHYQQNPVRTIKANTIGVINVLGLAKRHKARIIQASTSEVYGDPLEHPQKEAYRGNVNPFGPRACYDEGKRVAEALFFDYHRQNNVQIRVARIFNTFGPRMQLNDGRVVSNFIVQAIQNLPITIYGSGEQTRSFCFVSDLVQGLYKLMMYDDFTGPVNLGNPRELTIKEAAEKIIALTNSRSEIVHKPLPQDDPLRRKPDISLARQKLGWEPKVSFEEGLIPTIEYFKHILTQ